MVAGCGLSPEIRAHCKYGWEDLASISNSALDALAQITCPLHFPPRTFVLREGEPSHGVFMLRKGRAKLSTNTRGGRLLILGIVNASTPAANASLDCCWIPQPAIMATASFECAFL
jgi:CRP-like cAMP-binding protein